MLTITNIKEILSVAKLYTPDDKVSVKLVVSVDSDLYLIDIRIEHKGTPDEIIAFSLNRHTLELKAGKEFEGFNTELGTVPRPAFNNPAMLLSHLYYQWVTHPHNRPFTTV